MVKKNIIINDYIILFVMEPLIVLYGAGAIGCTIYRWLKPFYDNLFLLAHGRTADEIRAEGLSIYENSTENMDSDTSVNLVESIHELSKEPDIIIITVKTYSLVEVCQSIKADLKDKNPLIVALQNGVENMKILPNYFSRVIYGVICYNAWRDKPHIIGYKEKGPVILGTPENTLKEDMKLVQSIFQKGFLCEISSNYKDAAQNKILLNLSNSFFTLIGVGFQKIPSISKFRILTTSITSEGLKILRKVGVKEVKLGTLPSWSLLRIAATLPGFITNPIFKKTVEKSSGINSMAQDLLINKNHKTELESLNGYLISLANEIGFNAKINQKLYDICKREFSKEEFQPLDIDLVWEEFQDVL
jgi:2-dehydropantoate 2-reductase